MQQHGSLNGAAGCLLCALAVAQTVGMARNDQHIQPCRRPLQPSAHLPGQVGGGGQAQQHEVLDDGHKGGVEHKEEQRVDAGAQVGPPGGVEERECSEGGCSCAGVGKRAAAPTRHHQRRQQQGAVCEPAALYQEAARSAPLTRIR